MAEGYKDWAAGDILTAADLEDYTVKQSVMVFADASARTTALSSVLREGMVSYLKDTDSTEVYDGSAWAAVGGAAGILQVVSTTKTDTWSASIAAGGSSAVTGLSATITPSSTSNKILVIVHLHSSDGRDSINWAGMSVVRDGTTTVGSGDTAGNRSSVMGGHYDLTVDGANIASGHGTYLDSPSTTSATTYAVHAHRVSTITGTVYVNRTSGSLDTAAYLRTASSITLLEVSA
jgi:hypothetical protein